MSNHTPEPEWDGYARSNLWAPVDPDGCGPRPAGDRNHGDKIRRGQAINALTSAMERVVYAMRMPDGAIKIGCTKNLANRVSGLHGIVLGFRPGDFADETAIHDHLKADRARGREYYHATAEVLAVVNDMRDDFNLPHIAA